MTLDNSKSRFFIALLPPLAIQGYANEVKEYFAQNHNSRGALNSPPHITLQPPFEWQLDQQALLEEALSRFTKSQMPVPISLNGFGAFPPRVIYINVLKTPQLLTLQQDLSRYCEASLGIIKLSQHRAFVPHLTVAFRDLTKEHFCDAWDKFATKQVEYEFIVPQLTLLIHDGKRWNVGVEFPFEQD